MFFKSNKAKEKENDSKVKYIVAGLGNPGKKYVDTRHNAGFRALDYISQKYDFKIDQIKYSSFCKKFTVESAVIDESGENKKFDVLFMKPQTYMNNSGEAVAAAARFYKILPQNILVISDDISLPVGKMRIRRSGSDGGQKGLESIIYHLQSSEFPRIKIGIGEKPHPDYDLARWVTSVFSKDEQKVMFDIFGNVYEAVDIILKENNFDKAMNKFN